MKRHHKIKIGNVELTLALSFKASLEIMEQVESPTKIVESILMGHLAHKAGQEYEGEFEFNERNSVQIVTIGNADFEGLSFEDIGQLAMEDGFISFYSTVLNYLNEMVMGRSKETDEVEAAEPAEKPDGQSS